MSTKQKQRTGPKKTPTERMEAIAIASRMEREGYNQFEIGAKLGVSQPQACLYIKQAREAFKKEAIKEQSEMVKEKLLQYGDLRKTAWEEFRKSQKQIVANPDGEQEVVDRAGDPAFVRILMDICKGERDLMGLDAASKQVLLAGVATWDGILGNQAMVDPVESAISKLVDLGPAAKQEEGLDKSDDELQATGSLESTPPPSQPPNSKPSKNGRKH